jgi:hypothetical protein
MAILMFSSSRFGILAERAVERSAEFSPDALAAIVFSAFWVEAFVNEVIHRVNIDGKDLPNDPIGRLRQLAIAADLDGRDSRLDVKMQVIATSLTGSPFDTGRQPYQDFRLLMGLRNDLVHHKPETIKEAFIEHEGSTLNIPEALHSRIKSLVSRGIISEPDPKMFWSLVGILERPSVARWAFDAAQQMIRAVANCFPSPSYRQWLLDSQSALKEKGTTSENSA